MSQSRIANKTNQSLVKFRQGTVRIYIVTVLMWKQGVMMEIVVHGSCLQAMVCSGSGFWDGSKDSIACTRSPSTLPFCHFSQDNPEICMALKLYDE